MLALKVTLNGLDDLDDSLSQFKDILNDLSPEFGLVGDYLVGFFSNDVFATEGAAIGQNWPPLSPSYAAWKARNFPGRGLLQQSGLLQSSFTALPTSDYLTISNDTPYGGYLQYGTSRMPPRVFMSLSDANLAVIRDMIIDSLNSRAAAV